MSDTAVSLLTPPGTGAIATVEVRGTRAWELATQLFTPAAMPLPESPEANRFWFGTLGGDEVVLAVTSPVTIEVHCHGGRRVVRWVIEQFLARGCVERNPRPKGEGFDLLQRAPTLRTASIILDQLNGVFANEVQRILARLGSDPISANEPLRTLAELGRTVGRHLVEPWKVVVAGPPNVGKSSLVNALAGYQRTVVSEVAGTTRDAVGVRVAFDGWPFELIDTAGLREADGLEADGVARTREHMAVADLTVWVLDGTALQPAWPDGAYPDRIWYVVNKVDQPLAPWVQSEADDVPGVSATTGAGMRGLIDGILLETVGLFDTLEGATVPFPPGGWASVPGLAIPYKSHLAGLIETAHSAFASGRSVEAARLLHEALAITEADHVAGAAFGS